MALQILPIKVASNVANATNTTYAITDKEAFLESILITCTGVGNHTPYNTFSAALWQGNTCLAQCSAYTPQTLRIPTPIKMKDLTIEIYNANGVAVDKYITLFVLPGPKGRYLAESNKQPVW